MKKYEKARYDELKEGDVIMFYGALERVTKVDSFSAPANKYFPNEKTIRFELEPVNEESIKILGEFYSRGRYGGVGCITVTKVQFIND